jgi:hypothetical protein
MAFIELGRHGRAPSRRTRPATLPVDDERFAHGGWAPQRPLDGYTLGRPLRRALLESALTFGLMLALMVAVLALRARIAA